MPAVVCSSGDVAKEEEGRRAGKSCVVEEDWREAGGRSDGVSSMAEEEIPGVCDVRDCNSSCCARMSVRSLFYVPTLAPRPSLHPSTVGTHDPTLPLPLHLLMQFPQTDSPLPVSPHHLPRARHARVVQIQVQAHAGATPLALGVSMEGAGLRAGVRGEAGV